MTKTFTTLAAIAAAAFLGTSAVAAESKASKPKPYTPATCLVTGEKLGSMGKPYVHEYKGQEIKFCCKGCLKDFDKDPAKYMKKLQGMQAAHKHGPACKH